MLLITVKVENKGVYVEEATVSLIDSASGDTIENWYPLLPPESADSTVVFWSTKGAKAGKHTLTAVLATPEDGNSSNNRFSHTVTVGP